MSYVRIETTRRAFLLAAMMAASVLAQATDYPEISWDDLMPKGWDPSKSFQGMENFGTLSDTDPRLEKLYERMRKVWDNAPTVQKMKGRIGKIAGYLVPIEQGADGIREFLLVPYFGACIHLPPPPANQIVHVRAATPVTGIRTMSAVWVNGRFDLQRTNSELGASGYLMSADSVVKHKGTIGAAGR